MFRCGYYEKTINHNVPTISISDIHFYVFKIHCTIRMVCGKFKVEFQNKQLIEQINMKYKNIINT